MKRRRNPFGCEYSDQMHELQEWISDELVETWFGEDKVKHRLKCIKLQRLYDRLRLAREGLI